MQFLPLRSLELEDSWANQNLRALGNCCIWEVFWSPASAKEPKETYPHDEATQVH
jgi:hypothetical protein